MADERRRLVVSEAAGRADRWLAAQLEWSRSRVKELFEGGRVCSDGQPLRGKDALSSGQIVDVTLPPERPPAPLSQEPIEVEVLYQDEHLVVVDKPADMVVHPSKGHTSGTLVHALFDRIEAGAGDPERPGVVHRLDRGTSGVLVVARTRVAHAHLAAQFEAHSAERRYLALAWGALRDLTGTVDAPLGRHPNDRLRFAVVEGGRRAVTHWKRLGEARGTSLVECRLETGRTHQIRVHLAHLGHPLVGDPLYRRSGAPPTDLPQAVTAVDHQLLHARLLGFDHPATGQRLRFETPPPADFTAALRALGL